MQTFLINTGFLASVFGITALVILVPSVMIPVMVLCCVMGLVILLYVLFRRPAKK